MEQWAFFGNAEDEEPRFISAWHNWQKYGGILLSDDRGEMRGNPIKHTDLGVFDTLPESIFTDPEPVELPISE